MRKTSLVLMASIMAFAFLAAVPQDVAVADVSCHACIVGPVSNPGSGQYTKPSTKVWKNVGAGYTCMSACQTCQGPDYGICIDKYGCGFWCEGCKGQPPMTHGSCGGM
jgi:hypothetical protein